MSSSVSPEEQVPERAQQAALGLEREIDRLERHAGLGRDRRHRSRDVAVALEEPLRGFEDLPPRLFRLRSAAWRVVAALGVDRLAHFATLHITSIHTSSSQSRRCVMEAARIINKPDGRQGQGDVRAHLRGMWGAVAGAWAEHAVFADERGEAVAEAMLGATRPQPGERVLELACGPGGVGLAAAALVGADGVVVVSDIAPEMTAIARARAEARGLAQRPGPRPRSRADRRARRLVRRRSLSRGAHAGARPGAAPFARSPGCSAREVVFAVAVWGSRDAEPVARDRVRRGGGGARCADAPARQPGPFSLDDAATWSRGSCVGRARER